MPRWDRPSATSPRDVFPDQRCRLPAVSIILGIVSSAKVHAPAFCHAAHGSPMAASFLPTSTHLFTAGDFSGVCRDRSDDTGLSRKRIMCCGLILVAGHVWNLESFWV